MASYKELDAQIGLLVTQRRWADALSRYRECIDRFHNYAYTCSLAHILQHLDLSDQVPTLEQESDAGSGSSDLFLGYLYDWGEAGVRPNHDLASKHLQRAADRGYPFALYLQGNSARWLTDPVESQRWFLLAAQAGCPVAMRALAQEVDNVVEEALWLSKAAELDDPFAEFTLTAWLEESPQDCIPYGVWRPDRIYQRLLPTDMRQALFTWLLVAKRRRLARYVALLVYSFIVTRSGW